MIPTVYFFCERLVLKIHNGAAALIRVTALALFDNDGLERLTGRRYLRNMPHTRTGGM